MTDPWFVVSYVSNDAWTVRPCADAEAARRRVIVLAAMDRPNAIVVRAPSAGAALDIAMPTFTSSTRTENTR